MDWTHALGLFCFKVVKMTIRMEKEILAKNPWNKNSSWSAEKGK